MESGTYDTDVISATPQSEATISVVSNLLPHPHLLEDIFNR